MCYVATAVSGTVEAPVSDKSLTPRQRRTSHRAQLAIFRNDDSLFSRLLPLLELGWRDPATQHSLLIDAVIRLRVRMVRQLCSRLRQSPDGLAMRSEALVHLLQNWPHKPAQARAYQACLEAVLGEDSLADFPAPPEAIGWANLAVATDNPRLVELVMSLGAPLAGCRLDGGSLLHAIAELEASCLLRWSLEQGQDPNVCDTKGETPLHIAARCGNLDALTRLVAAGGSLDCSNEEGNTPLAFFDHLGQAGWAWYHQRKALELDTALPSALAPPLHHQRF